MTLSSFENTTPSVKVKLSTLLSCCSVSMACLPTHVMMLGFSCFKQLPKLLLVNCICMVCIAHWNKINTVKTVRDIFTFFCFLQNFTNISLSSSSTTEEVLRVSSVIYSCDSFHCTFFIIFPKTKNSIVYYETE